MGCVLTCLEHLVWSNIYDKAVQKATNKELLVILKNDFIAVLDRAIPKDLDAVYDTKSGELVSFRGIALNNSAFTIRLGDRITLEFD